ncbi:MAG: SDR family oxidoreductase [Firmicutes bacterium]|nr:SDR family oxidoreductase [Bacillota bacterium]
MAAALVTGASSGIGREIALILSELGYDLVLVARDEQALKETAAQAKTRCIVLPADLSVRENCKKVYESTKKLDIEILVNDAGFGVFGEFTESPLDRQLNMLDVNVSALHTLMYLFLRDFRRKNKGHILNVGSLAAFAPGPLLSGYYAGKAYVLNLSLAAAHELKRQGSSVKISVLCPGPVNTDFNRRAGVEFSIKPLSAKTCAKAGVVGMFNGKTVIIPGLFNKIGAFGMRFMPRELVMSACYFVQHRKRIKK